MMKHIIITILSFLIITNLNLDAQKGDKKKTSMDKMWGESSVSNQASLKERTAIFDDGNFGMFIHWGIFSHLGGIWNGKTYYGIGEWIMHQEMAGIPADEYIKLAKEFNPVYFDARQIANLAKSAGMKYIIITSKHHDGFAMFGSKASPFNIVDATPFARDPMKELSAACRELGLGFGFYYSHYQDWTTPGASGGPEFNPDGSKADFKDYFYKKCKPQVEEICKNYGEIDFIWFDTPGDMPKKYVLELAETVRKLQPNALLCSRIGHGLGDYSTIGDMEIPTSNISGLWETADTNNDSWSYAWYDSNFKSPKMILQRLVSTVARGGTYLLNVGPDGTGRIPDLGVNFLLEAGKWIQKYPQVIYAAGSSPWGHALPWGDVTTRDNSLFLNVFEWPEDGKLYLPMMQAPVSSARLINGPEISYRVEGTWIVLDLPCLPPDPLISVIELKLEQKAENLKISNMHCIYPNIETSLLAEFAEVTNAAKESRNWMEKFGEWKHVMQISNWENEGKAEWTVEVFEPGNYYIDICHRGEGKLVWRITTDEGITVQNQQPATMQYQIFPLGIIEFKKPGKHTITVSLIEGNRKSSSLKSIIIKPLR